MMCLPFDFFARVATLFVSAPACKKHVSCGIIVRLLWYILVSMKGVLAMKNLHDDEDDYYDPLIEAARNYKRKCLIKKFLLILVVAASIVGGIAYNSTYPSQMVVEASQNQ